MIALPPLHRIAAATLFCATAALLTHAASAQTVTVDAPAAATDKIERNFSLDYKNKRLTFYEDGKVNLFATTVTTSLVGVRLETGTVRSGCKISLRDGAGKILWSDVLTMKSHGGKNLRGTLNFTANTNGGIKILLSANNADVDDSDQELSSAVLTATIRSDNKLQAGDFVAEDTRIHMGLLKDSTGLVFTRFKDSKWEEVARVSYDAKKQSLHGIVNGEKVAINGVGKNSKTVRAVVNGKEVATVTAAGKGLVMSDGNSTVKVKPIKRDGKDYTEVLLGGQRLLMQPGSFKIEEKDGAYILTPTAPAPLRRAEHAE